MVMSKAATVEDYLAGLPPERRDVVAKVRALVRRHLPRGYVEGMSHGMIGWVIPLSRYPDTYNRQPLGYVALAAQKNHYALYLMSCYAESRALAGLVAAYRKAGRRLDMGRCCLRFRALEDLEMDAVGRAIAAVGPEEYIAIHEAARAGTKAGARAKAAAKRAPAGRAGAKRSAVRAKKPARRS